MCRDKQGVMSCLPIIIMIQLFLAVTTILSIGLSQSTDKNKQKYASLCGLGSAPFWLYSTFSWDQWGQFTVSVIIFFIWVNGFYNYWLCKKQLPTLSDFSDTLPWITKYNSFTLLTKEERDLLMKYTEEDLINLVINEDSFSVLDIPKYSLKDAANFLKSRA